MNRILSDQPPHLREVDILGTIADLKEDLYRNSLLLATLLELLIEKGFVTERDIQQKASAIDNESDLPL